MESPMPGPPAPAFHNQNSYKTAIKQLLPSEPIETELIDDYIGLPNDIVNLILDYFPTFQYYISTLENDIEVYQTTFDRTKYIAPELAVSVPYNDGTAHMIERGSLIPGIQAHKDRVIVLKRMKNNESITEIEHQLVLQIPALKEDPKIAGYAKFL